MIRASNKALKVCQQNLLRPPLNHLKDVELGSLHFLLGYLPLERSAVLLELGRTPFFSGAFLGALPRFRGLFL